jgi:hypothetical protein
MAYWTIRWIGRSNGDQIGYATATVSGAQGKFILTHTKATGYVSGTLTF